MNIYFIGQKGIPATMGGVEKHVEELSLKLAENQQNNVFVYTRPHYTPTELKNYKNVKLISLPSIPTKHLDAITHTFLACLDLIRRKADIIHFHSIGPSFLIWLPKLLNYKAKVIFTYHSQDYFHQKWGFLARFCLKLGERIACLMADEVIAVSQEIKSYIKNEYGRQAHYIPNGVSAGLFLEANEIKKWDLEKNNYILALSRLIRHKGLHYLIEAFKQVKTDLKLVITGAGSHTEEYVQYLKKLAQNDERIVFTNAQTGSTLAELMTNARLFVCPSENEGLSIAVLEAMSYGLPILASDIEANKEIIEDNGYFFKSKNVLDLKNQLENLINQDKDLTLKAMFGKKRVEQDYNWKKISIDVEQVYKTKRIFFPKTNSSLINLNFSINQI